MTLAQRIRIPDTDLNVSRLCLGGNRLGGALDQDASFALLDAFVEAGGNFIDTAHVYADWLPGVERSCSEKTIGRWRRSRGEPHVVIATKGGHPLLADPSVRRLDARSLREDAEASRDHLGVPRSDLYYLHRDDPERPVADILAALEELRQKGVVRHYAASNWSAVRLAEAAKTAAAHGWSGFVANQPEWSLATRNPGSAPADLLALDAAMAAFHARTGTALVPYSAQAQGYFDKAPGQLTAATARTYDNPRNRALGEVLSEAAARLGGSPTGVMLAAMLRAPFPVIPVVGCRTPGQVRASFASLALPLSQPDADRLLRAGGLAIADRP
jgi:aryl-alcohol dehydrogenase-like predicted oxidoreductase